MTFPTVPCKSCGAAIVWARNPKTGKLSPVTAEPSEKGNCRLVDRGLKEPEVEVLGRDARLEALEADPELRLRLNHFADCPTAAQHRKPKETV